MATDPYMVEAADGEMLHTFTGFIETFANITIHEIFSRQFVPLRNEMMRRTETSSESSMPEPLRTKMMEGLDAICRAIQQGTLLAQAQPPTTLQARVQQRTDFVNRIVQKAQELESLSRELASTHADEVLHAAQMNSRTVSFDYPGDFDLDWAQPTPARVQHPTMRAFVIGLDLIMVKISQSHSRDLVAGILKFESGQFIAALSMLYNIIDDTSHVRTPEYPTAVSLNERASLFNNDGSKNWKLDQGKGIGEASTTTRMNPGS